jgi:ubiquinone/menaquinone biosynthesis C-methylase UbiE
MLNPTFPQTAKKRVTSPYVLDEAHAQATVTGNEAMQTGVEYRLQSVYGDELWRKLEHAGLAAEQLASANILEVCAGTGLLTYHLLERCKPASMTVNDISPQEMAASQALLARSQPKVNISWVLGDMHQVAFKQQFDVIIGNSFLHHFHDVPRALTRFAELLSVGGVFVSLHEPTPMSTVVEGAKLLAYPLAVLFPGLVNDIARARYNGQPSPTDIWMFEPYLLKRVALQAGFSKVKLIPWHLLRTLVVQQRGLHLGPSKTELTPDETESLSLAISKDASLNRVLPSRFFGSICLVCYK